MTLGERIYDYRKRCGFSQEALAERVGVSRQAVSRWELGEATPEVGKLMALAEAFGITVDELLNGKKPEEAPGTEETVTEDPTGSDAWDKLPGFLRRMVRRHGWLAGVYIALRGLGVAVVGGIARFAFGQMFRVAVDGFEGVGGALVTDAAGNPISLPPEAMEAIYKGVWGTTAAGGSFSTGQVTVVSDVGRIFVGIATAILIAGILVTIGGLILAAVLYEKGRKN